jgi:hypothetical protein
MALNFRNFHQIINSKKPNQPFNLIFIFKNSIFIIILFVLLLFIQLVIPLTIISI